MLSAAVRMCVCGALLLGISPAMAGPPSQPTDYKHFEIYDFTNGTATRANTSGEAGIDINYGGAPNLQLTATLPAAYSVPDGGPFVGGLGNVELAAKYRFLTQQNFGWMLPFFQGCSCRTVPQISASTTLRTCSRYGCRKTGANGRRSAAAAAAARSIAAAIHKTSARPDWSSRGRLPPTCR